MNIGFVGVVEVEAVEPSRVLARYADVEHEYVRLAGFGHFIVHL